jgi:DNA-binding CsgD family transcriptional regulator
MLIQQADHRVVSVRTSCSSWPLNGELELFHHLHTDLLARRGSVRMLFTSSASSDPAAIADLRQFSQAGAQIRVYPCDLPMMIIMDSIASIVGTIGRDGQTHLTVVRDESVIRALQAFHNAIWKQAIGILALREFAVDWNEPIIRKVLELLASGYTDETAARKLNLSVRTYRRYTAQLMGQLKAKSRFEAGVLAARLGLVESDRLSSAMAVRFDQKTVAATTAAGREVVPADRLLIRNSLPVSGTISPGSCYRPCTPTGAPSPLAASPHTPHPDRSPG